MSIVSPYENRLTSPGILLDSSARAPQSWRTTFQRMPAMMHSVDPRGRLIEVSDRWLSVLGYERDEVIGRFSGEFLTEASKIYSHEVIFPEFFRTGTIERQPQEFVTKSGKIVEVEISATMEPEPDGWRCVAVLVDVSERNQSHRELVDRERLYRETLTYSPEMIVRSLPDSTVIYANRRYLELCGLSEAEMLGRRSLDFRPPEVVEGIMKTLPAFRTGQTVTTREYSTVGPNGETRWYSWTDRAILGTDGTIREILSVGRDVTESKLMSERHRQQSEKLARLYDELMQANEGLRQFSRILSHDLQEPLRKMVAYSEVLRYAIREGNPGDRDLATGVIADAATRASHMVADLVRYCRVADADIRREDIPARALVDEVVRSLQAEIDEAGTELVSDLPADLSLRTDPVQARQIIQNLVSNAIKYRCPKRPSRVEIRFERGPAGNVLSVSDNGIGFEPRYKDMIFEPFRRLHATGPYRGSGIGLAICATGARRLGWRLEVDSEVAVGSVFSVRIPDRDLSA